MREMADRELAGRDMVQRRRGALARRSHGTGLEYGLIAAALAVAIVTVVAGLGTRYGSVSAETGTTLVNAVDRSMR